MKAADLGGYTGDYDAFPILPAALATLKPGKNVVAIHVRQATGGQFIDLSFVEQVSPKK